MSENTKNPLHPVYTVANIQNKVRVLDGNKVTYSNWVKLFRLHAIGYKVLDHIDGDNKPKSDDSSYNSWVEIDAIVLQWIYGTLSDDLLTRVLESDTTARAAWVKIQNIFLNNKGSRAAAQQEFTNLTLASCSSMDEYCQKLKDLADQLGDVDNPVSGSRLVLQLVRGLPAEYDTVASFINQSSPTWDTARSMLQLEQHRLAARQKSTTTALVAPAVDNNNQQVQQSGNSGRRRGRGKNNGGRGNKNGRGGQGGRGPSGQPTAQPQSVYPPWAWWAPPPCPYPSQPPTWTAPQPPQWRPAPTAASQATAHAAFSGGNPNGPSQPGTYDAMSPHGLASAFQAMNMNYNDPSWYMDIGASNHITSDAGPPEWKDNIPPQ